MFCDVKKKKGKLQIFIKKNSLFYVKQIYSMIWNRYMSLSRFIKQTFYYIIIVVSFVNFPFPSQPWGRRNPFVQFSWNSIKNQTYFFKNPKIGLKKKVLLMIFHTENLFIKIFAGEEKVGRQICWAEGKKRSDWNAHNEIAF